MCFFVLNLFSISVQFIFLFEFDTDSDSQFIENHCVTAK